MLYPDYIEKVKAYYDQEVLSVPGCTYRYVGRLPDRLRFLSDKGRVVTLPFDLLDLALSHIAAGRSLNKGWVMEHCSGQFPRIVIIRALSLQFGRPEPRKGPIPSTVESPTWQNPGFIAKVQQYFDSEERFLHLQQTTFRYTGRKKGKLRFVSIRNEGFLLSFESLDLAYSRYSSGTPVTVAWLRKNSVSGTRAPVVLRAILAQFADRQPTK